MMRTCTLYKNHTLFAFGKKLGKSFSANPLPKEKSKSCCFICGVDKLHDSGGPGRPSSPKKLLNSAPGLPVC